MRVGTRLASGFLALILLFGGPLFFYNRVVERSVQTARELESVDSHLLLSTTSQLELLDQLSDAVEKYRITSDDGYFDQYYGRRSALADSMAVLQGLAVTGNPREAVEELYATWDEFETRFASEPDKRREAKRLFGLSDAEWAEFERMIGTLQREARVVRFASRTSMASKLRDMSERAARASATGWLALGGSIALGLVLSILIVRSITRPRARIDSPSTEGTKL